MIKNQFLAHGALQPQSSSASRQLPRDEVLGMEVESGLDSMFGCFLDNDLGQRVELTFAEAGRVGAACGMASTSALRGLARHMWGASLLAVLGRKA